MQSQEEETKIRLTEIGIYALISPHKRFTLESEFAPDRTKIPNPYHPKIKKIKLVSMIMREALSSGLRIFTEEERKVVLSRPCIYGVFSGRFGGLMPRREYCTGCMRCVQEYPSICTVDRNPEFLNLGDAYWIPRSQNIAFSNPVFLVNYEARTGKIPIKGMGYKGTFSGDKWDSMWTDMSEIVRPTRDGVHGREYISTMVDLGRKPELSSNLKEDTKKASFRVVKVPIPIIFDQFSNLINEASVLKSIANASRRIPTLFIESPRFIDAPAEQEDRLWVPLICSPHELLLLNEIRYRPLMLEVTSEGSLLEEARSRYPSSVILLRVEEKGTIQSILAKLDANKADGIHLVANYHGEFILGKEKLFIKDVIHEVHESLVAAKMREQVTIIAGGGITLAEHVPKAIIMGADATSLDTSLGVALQLKFSGEVKERAGSSFRRERIDVSWGEKRITNLLGSWHGQLIEILSAMGIKDVRRLRGDIGRAMFNEELEKEAFGDLEWR